MTLKELYNGNINPSSKLIKNGGEYQKLNNHLAALLDSLEQSLTEKDSLLTKEISDTICEAEYISQMESYIEGFRSGAQLMLEIIKFESNNFV